MIRYPFLDLAKVTAPYSDELKEACCRVIDSGRYIGGDEVESFERMLADSCGAAYAVGVANGLDALRLILRGYIELGEMKPGDEVIVPSNTYIATVLAVTDMGLKSVFVEPSLSTMNIDDTLIEAAVTPRTRAILTVHLYGQPAYSRLMADVANRHGLKLIEDNAQAIGASVDGVSTGHLGDAAAFSFYPTKNIGAIGDAGAVTTDNLRLAETVRALANYGSTRRYHNVYQGYNSRLDTIQAAMLKVRLSHLEEETEGRRAIAGVYGSCISNPEVLLPREVTGRHVWHQYVVRVSDRQRFRDYMLDCGVGTDVNYPLPPHRQPCYKEYSGLSLPLADKISAEVVSLPINPACTSLDDARAISEIVNNYNHV